MLVMIPAFLSMREYASIRDRLKLLNAIRLVSKKEDLPNDTNHDDTMCKRSIAIGMFATA